MATFEGYERRIDKINAALAQYGIESLEAADALLKDKGIDVRSIVLGIQPIAFENAVWAYTLGAAIAVKKGVKTAADAAEAIGEGLQAFCIPGSVADQRQVGLGVWNLFAPKSAWWLARGWWYKNAEPSDLAIAAYRIGGVCLLIAGVICAIAAL